MFLSLLGSIASIIALYSQMASKEAAIAIVVLGVLLLVSMLHDWYFVYQYRKKAKYENVCSELNAINTLIRNRDIQDVQIATDLLTNYCEAISNMFSTLKGHRIGVCIKLITTDGNDAEIITQARDRYSISHNRKTGTSDTTIHKMESNSDFSFIYNHLESDIEDSTFYHSPNLVNEIDYRNSRLNNWKPKKISFLPQSVTRKSSWPLPYKSTIVVPIFPLESNFQNKDNLRGFLCVDSDRTNTFEIPIDKEILRGLAAELCPIIDKLVEIA